MVTYTYYPSGLTYTATPEGGQAVTMEYNLQGKRTKLTDPDGGVVETVYNGFGELTEEKQFVHSTAEYVRTTNNYYPNGLMNIEKRYHSFSTSGRLFNVCNVVIKEKN